MANGIRINNLNQATSLNDTDTITIIQDNENKKASISLFDKDGTYTQSVVNTIPDLITTSKANVETTKQAIDEKFGDDKFSTQIITSQEMSSVGVSDDGSVDVSSQVQDGFMESAILTGNTLVNLVKTSVYGGVQNGTCVDGDYPYKVIESAVGDGASILTRFQTIYPLSPSTVYYLKLTDVAPINAFLVREHDNGKNLITEIHDLENKIIKFTTSELGTSDLFFYQRQLQVGARVKYSENLIISNDVESLYSADDYFTGMQSVKMPVLITIGKNLLNTNNITLGSYVSGGGVYGSEVSFDNDAKRAYITIPVKPNTKYKYKSNNIYGYLRCMKNLTVEAGRVSGNSLTHTITTTEETNYISINLRHTDETKQLTREMIDGAEIMFVEGSVATPYEPYKPNILTINEPIELGSANNIEDSLNVTTGQVTINTKEIVLDGSNTNWSVNDFVTNEDFVYCETTAFDSEVSDTANLKSVCDKLPLVDGFNRNSMTPTKNVICTFFTYAKIRLALRKSELISNDSDGVNDWLNKNNLTLRFPLKESIIKTVDLNSSNGDAKTPIVYKNGHILLQSDGLIPELHYSIPVSYNGLIAQNIMTNLKHSWRLDELEIMAYTSIVNSQYESLILVATAETNEVVVSSDYVQDESLYNMLKVLVNANALENADEKINVFYLYGKLSDEMYIDLIMGDDM